MRPALRRIPLWPILAAAMLTAAPGPASRAFAQAAPVDLRILAINDFHGNLRPPTGGIPPRPAASCGSTEPVSVGSALSEPPMKP